MFRILVTKPCRLTGTTVSDLTVIWADPWLHWSQFAIFFVHVNRWVRGTGTQCWPWISYWKILKNDCYLFWELDHFQYKYAIGIIFTCTCRVMVSVVILQFGTGTWTQCFFIFCIFVTWSTAPPAHWYFQML